MSLKPDLVVGTNVPFHVMLRKPLEMAGVPLYLNMINSYEDVLKRHRRLWPLCRQRKGS